MEARSWVKNLVAMAIADVYFFPNSTEAEDFAREIEEDGCEVTINQRTKALWSVDVVDQIVPTP